LKEREKERKEKKERKKSTSQAWWLTSVIPATWEAEVRRITRPHLNHKVGIVAHTCKNGSQSKVGPGQRLRTLSGNN
jgi:hypothetical protein